MMDAYGLAQTDWLWIVLAMSVWLILSVPLGIAIGRALASGRPQPQMVSERRSRPLLIP